MNVNGKSCVRAEPRSGTGLGGSQPWEGARTLQHLFADVAAAQDSNSPWHNVTRLLAIMRNHNVFSMESNYFTPSRVPPTLLGMALHMQPGPGLLSGKAGKTRGS